MLRKDYELLLQNEGSTNTNTFIDLWAAEVRSGSGIEMNAVLRGTDDERHVCPSCGQPHRYAVLDQEKYTKWYSQGPVLYTPNFLLTIVVSL